MYHKFSAKQADAMTVTTAQLSNHLEVLTTKGFEFITVGDWLSYIYQGVALPRRPVLLTFDDAYASCLTLAYPVLKAFGARATLFVPTAYVGSTSSWDTDAAPLLTVEELRRLDPAVFELALHTHKHLSYGQASATEMANDLGACIAFFDDQNLPFVRALAYPYGSRPAEPSTYKEMVRMFQMNDIQAAFRIGNRINPLMPKNLYEINRLDIRGSDSLFTFRRKLWIGRLL